MKDKYNLPLITTVAVLSSAVSGCGDSDEQKTSSTNATEQRAAEEYNDVQYDTEFFDRGANRTSKRTFRIPTTGDWRSNTRPVADISAPHTYISGETVVLDGSGSYDDDGDDLRFFWKQINGPMIELDACFGDTLTFVAPEVSEPTKFNFFLVVYDGMYADLAGFSLQVSPVEDGTTPAISGRFPQPDQNDVPTNTEITVTFNEALSESYIDEYSLILTNSGSLVPGNVSYDDVSHSIIFSPNSTLEGETQYTVTLGEGIQDIAGNPVPSESWEFTTAASSGDDGSDDKPDDGGDDGSDDKPDDGGDDGSDDKPDDGGDNGSDDKPDDGGDDGSDDKPDDGGDDGSDDKPDDGGDDGSDDKPDDGGDNGSDDKPDDGGDDGSDDKPDDGGDDGSNDKPDDGGDDGSDDKPDDGGDDGSNDNPDDGGDDNTDDGSNDNGDGSNDNSVYNLGATTQQTMDACMDEADKQMLTLVNNARAQTRSCGTMSYQAAPAVSWNCQLENAALGHSQSMADNNYFDHTGIDGSSPGDRISAAGYNWKTYGENIAAGYRDAETVMEGWLTSPGHCANLMNASFEEVGVGVVNGGSGTYGIYWTQNFATQ